MRGGAMLAGEARGQQPQGRRKWPASWTARLVEEPQTLQETGAGCQHQLVMEGPRDQTPNVGCCRCAAASGGQRNAVAVGGQRQSRPLWVEVVAETEERMAQ